MILFVLNNLRRHWFVICFVEIKPTQKQKAIDANERFCLVALVVEFMHILLRWQASSSIRLDERQP